jgi:hypothetical protein
MILIIMPLAKLSNMLLDDDYHNETCRGSFIVNFNILPKKICSASVGK